MIEQTQAQGTSPFEDRYNKQVVNATPGTIPAWACMQIVNANVVDDEEAFSVIQPNGAAKAQYLFNGPFPIAGAYGSATDQFPTTATFNAGLNGDSPNSGQEYGPVKNSWNLSSKGKGYLIVGGIVNPGPSATDPTNVTGMMQVGPLPSSTSADPPLRIFEILADLASNALSVQAVVLNNDPAGSFAKNADGSQQTFTLANSFRNYYGKAANQTSKTFTDARGFQGQAVLRRDPSNTAPDEWEIVNMDQWLREIKGQLCKVSNYPANGSNIMVKFIDSLNPSSQTETGWERRYPVPKNQFVPFYNDPAIPFDATGISEPLPGFNSVSYWPYVGTFHIADPTLSPPSYRIQNMRMFRWGRVTTAFTKRGAISSTTGTGGTGNFPVGGGRVILWDETGHDDGVSIAVENRINIGVAIGADAKVDFSFSPPRLDEATCGP